MRRWNSLGANASRLLQSPAGCLNPRAWAAAIAP
jgi:hypothetical protein